MISSVRGTLQSEIYRLESPGPRFNSAIGNDLSAIPGRAGEKLDLTKDLLESSNTVHPTSIRRANRIIIIRCISGPFILCACACACASMISDPWSLICTVKLCHSIGGTQGSGVRGVDLSSLWREEFNTVRMVTCSSYFFPISPSTLASKGANHRVLDTRIHRLPNHTVSCVEVQNPNPRQTDGTWSGVEYECLSKRRFELLRFLVKP